MASNLRQYDPFRELARFDPMHGFEDFFRDFRLRSALGEGGDMQIRIDVGEDEQGYLVKAEIPGVNKDDIKIDIDGSRVTISAETRRENEVQSGAMLRSERFVGQRYRSFTLERDIDDEKAAAKYQDGVLELTLPKKGGGGAKKLSIS